MRTGKNRWLMEIIVPVIAGMFLFLSGEISAAPPQGILKEAVHMGISADWLDPATTSAFSISSFIPLYLLHDALLKPMPGDNYAPCLAESWSVSPDSKVYEFKLRKGVKFHNGDSMTSEDVVFSFWRYKAAQAKFIQGKIEKVEAVNPYLVRFQFKESFPDFLGYLLPGSTTIGWVVPKKYVEKVGEAGFKNHPIGAGPYKFVEFVPGVKLVTEAFEGYWRKVPRIKRIEFHVVSEPATRLAMARRGEMDTASLMTDVFYEDVKKDPKLRLAVVLNAPRNLLYITSQWDPKSPWSDARVRKAASLALDRKSLVDVHYPGANPIGSLGMDNDSFSMEFPADPYDPGRAKKLLAEAGYPNGFPGGKFYPYGGYWPYGEQIATYLKAVGITVDTVLLERPAWIAMREGGKMKGGIFHDVASAPTTVLRLSYLLGPTSYGSYPDIQSLWDRFQPETATEVRKDLITKIQRLIYEKTMFVPTNSGSSPAAVGPRVKGNPYNIQPLIWFTAPFEDIELTE